MKVGKCPGCKRTKVLVFTGKSMKSGEPVFTLRSHSVERDLTRFHDKERRWSGKPLSTMLCPGSKRAPLGDFTTV